MKHIVAILVGVGVLALIYWKYGNPFSSQLEPDSAPDPSTSSTAIEYNAALGAGKISTIQSLLAQLNFLQRSDVDGISGPKTEQAVRNFQQEQSLSVDGKAGPLTQKALIAAVGVTPDTGSTTE